MGIEEASDLARGHLPALNACSDQTFSLLIAHHLHQPRIALVHIFFQGGLQFLCKAQNARRSLEMCAHTFAMLADLLRTEIAEKITG